MIHQKLISFWKYGKAYCGLEVTGAVDKEKYKIVRSRLIKGEFVDFEFQQSENMEDLPNLIGKRQHAFLVLNTSNVLIRETEIDDAMETMVSNAFPGLALDEFYVQLVPGKNSAFVAVCRKDYVDRLIERLIQNQIEVVGFELSFSPLLKLVSLIDQSVIQTSGHRIEMEENQVVSITTNISKEEHYNIEGIEVNSGSLLATAILLGYLHPTGEETLNFSERNQLLHRSYSERNTFRKGLVAGIGLLLLVLLVNFLVFNSYFKKQQYLQEQVVISADRKEGLTEKQKRVEHKERTVERILSGSSSQSSRYINWMAANRPKTLMFDRIGYQPLERTIRPDKPIQYRLETIVVEGTSTDADSFSRWIEIMEEMEWVKGLTIYGFGSIQGRDQFKLEVQLDHGTKE